MARIGAKESRLGILHELLTEMFIIDIKNCMGDGDEYIPMSAADKGCIIAFLKNNEISSAPDAEQISELKEAFKDLSAERKAKTDALFAKVESSDDMGLSSILS